MTAVEVHRSWECPDCHRRTDTADPRPAAPCHPCPAHRGLGRPYGQIRGDLLELNRGLPTHQIIRRGM